MEDKYTVEMPNTDAIRVFKTRKEALAYIDSLDVQEFHYKWGQFTIPEFAEGREEYSRKKQIECDRWGCE